MLKNYVRAALGLALLAGLPGCAVYTPMQAAAPEIRARGELEVTTSWSLTDRLDLAATYSPLPHLLVRAATSLKGSRPATDSATYSQNNQYELQLGTYWPLGRRWLAGGLLGAGQAHAQARYDNDGGTGRRLFIRDDAVPHDFDAIYAKYSAEAYLTYQPIPAFSLGLAYRVVQLRLTDVTDRGQLVAPQSILRYEPMLYCRARPLARRQFPLQFQLALGFSDTFGYNESRLADQGDPARQFKLGRGYTTVGVTFWPHLLWQKKVQLRGPRP